VGAAAEGLGGGRKRQGGGTWAVVRQVEGHGPQVGSVPQGLHQPGGAGGPLLTGFIQNKSAQLETRVYVHVGTQCYMRM